MVYHNIFLNKLFYYSLLLLYNNPYLNHNFLYNKFYLVMYNNHPNNYLHTIMYQNEYIDHHNLMNNYKFAQYLFFLPQSPIFFNAIKTLERYDNFYEEIKYDYLF